MIFMPTQYHWANLSKKHILAMQIVLNVLVNLLQLNISNACVHNETQHNIRVKHQFSLRKTQMTLDML